MATFKITSEDTGGAYTSTEETWPPQVGPPPHIHHTQEEIIYVLEGKMEFVTDGITTRATAGSLVRIPKGVLRDYRNVGSEPAKVLGVFAPGGFEGFFEEVGKLVTDSSAPLEGPPDVERLVAAAVKYGCEVPPPSPRSSFRNLTRPRLLPVAKSPVPLRSSRPRFSPSSAPPSQDRARLLTRNTRPSRSLRAR